MGKINPGGYPSCTASSILPPAASSVPMRQSEALGWTSVDKPRCIRPSTPPLSSIISVAIISAVRGSMGFDSARAAALIIGESIYANATDPRGEPATVKIAPVNLSDPENPSPPPVCEPDLLHAGRDQDPQRCSGDFPRCLWQIVALRPTE